MTGPRAWPKTVQVWETDWQMKAACTGSDPAIFFPGRGKPAPWAKQICSTCPVQTACLLFALHHPTWCRDGVYGGTTSNERRHMRLLLTEPIAVINQESEIAQ